MWWLDKGEFYLLTREYDVYRKEEDKGTYLREPLEDTVAYMPCVRCGKLMSRKNFARISRVIIDECGTHGVWLDAGELEKIRQFIVDGGLERAQDVEIEKIQTELRDLETLEPQEVALRRLSIIILLYAYVSAVMAILSITNGLRGRRKSMLNGVH